MRLFFIFSLGIFFTPTSFASESVVPILATSSASSTIKSVVYHQITSVATGTATVTVNTLSSRDQYMCTMSTLQCVLSLAVPSVREEQALFEVEKVETEFKNIIPDNLGDTVPEPKTHSTTTIPHGQIPDFAIKDYTKVSPKGTWVAYYVQSPDMVREWREYAVTSTTSSTTVRYRETVSAWDLVTDTSTMFGWNEDESILIYMSDRDGAPALYTVDMNKAPLSLKGTILTNSRYTVEMFVVHNNTVYFVANRKAPYVWGLYALSLEPGSKVEIISENVLSSNMLRVVDDLVLFNENQNGVSVLRAYSTKDKTVQSFTGLPEYTLEDIKKTTSQINLKTGRGWYIRSHPKAKKAVLWIHGGPYRQTFAHRHPYASYGMFDWMLDEALKKDVAIFKLDYPGSFGFGTAYGQRIRTQVGVIDMQTMLEAVRFLKSKGHTDVYVFGNSYGGYMTAKAIAQYGSQLKGGVAVAPVIDWEKMIRQLSPSPFEVHFNGVPQSSNQKLFDRASILNVAQMTTAPLTLIHGDKDLAVPYNQSEYGFVILQESGVPVQLFTAKNQGHVFRSVTSIEETCRVLLHTLTVPVGEDTCKIK